MYKKSKDFKDIKKVTECQLDDIIESKIVKMDELTSPIIIKKIELLFRDGLYFIRTTSKEGLVGISVANDRVEYVYPILNKLIAPYFIGRDARELETLLEEVYVYKNNYKMAGLPYWCCIAYLELSILDMLAKAQDKPLGEIIGNRINGEANIYVASGNRHTTPEEELEVLRQRIEKTGAKAIKYKIGGRMSKNKDSIQGRSKSLIYLTRKFFGDNMVIHADGNGSYDVKHAIEYGKVLEDINAYFYEEPCPFDDLVSTKKVADALDIPLAFGEQETSLTRFKWLVLNNGADVIQPDILYNGGLIKTTKVARMAELAGMTITPHVSAGFGFVYILHLASYTPNIGKYIENKRGFEQANELLDGYMELKDGKINIPTLPGVGIRSRNSIFEKADVIFTVE